MCAAQILLIDSLKFVREGKTLRGSLPVAGFERLRDNLWSTASDAGTVDYKVSGGADVRERPVLQLKVSGRLSLQCQRCLDRLEHELAVDTTLRLVPETSLDVEQSDEPDEPDCIAASAELDVAALIEDEILLALPAYPRHEEGSCGEAVTGSTKVSAFSALSEHITLSTLKQKEFKSKE